MRDFAELVKALRVCGSAPYDCSDCLIESDKCNGVMSLFSKAADAIEELLAAFCLLCGICTSPPSAETFNSCEIVRGCLPELSKEVQDG